MLYRFGRPKHCIKRLTRVWTLFINNCHKKTWTLNEAKLFQTLTKDRISSPDHSPTHASSEAPVLQFAKRTRTGYFAGTGTRTVRTHDTPILFFCFFNLGTVTVRRWYSQGTHNRFFLKKWGFSLELIAIIVFWNCCYLLNVHLFLSANSCRSRKA